MTDACTPRVALALDSAGLACSVAVSLGEEVVAEEHIDTMHGQAEAPLLLVDKAMRVAGQVPAAPNAEDNSTGVRLRGISSVVERERTQIAS